MVTQSHIAEKLGVSRRSVAHALSGNGRMSDETRQRIRDEAERLGYAPNRVAQALVTGRTHQIALCFPWFFGSSFYNAIIHEFESLARHSPYDLLMVTVDPDDKNGKNIRWPADGTIFVGSSLRMPENIVQPTVILQNQPRYPLTARAAGYDRVQFNLEHASFQAIQHLLEEGHRNIAFVAPNYMIGDFDWRYHAYEIAMQEAGLKTEVITLPINGEGLLRQRSHQILKEYFSQNGFPDALFCCNDDIGIGAYRALGQLNRKIPNETAVMGFDDFDDSQFLSPPMSSVHMPIKAVCSAAWKTLMQRIENKELPPQFEAVEAHLVVRESSLGKSKKA